MRLFDLFFFYILFFICRTICRMLHDFIHAKLFISALNETISKRQSFSLQSKSFVILIFLTVLECEFLWHSDDFQIVLLEFCNFPPCSTFKMFSLWCCRQKKQKVTMTTAFFLCKAKVAKSNICVRHFVGKMQQGWSFLLFVTSMCSRHRSNDARQMKSWMPNENFGFSV